jgi:hypothetical protein
MDSAPVIFLFGLVLTLQQSYILELKFKAFSRTILA